MTTCNAASPLDTGSPPVATRRDLLNLSMSLEIPVMSSGIREVRNVSASACMILHLWLYKTEYGDLFRGIVIFCFSVMQNLQMCGLVPFCGYCLDRVKATMSLSCVRVTLHTGSPKPRHRSQFSKTFGNLFFNFLYSKQAVATCTYCN